MIRRSLLNKMGGGTVKLLSGGKNSRLAVAGDILLAYDNGTKLMIVDKADYNTSAYPTAQYTKIGTVAVPGTHNVYGDGSCGVANNNGEPTSTSVIIKGAVPSYAHVTTQGYFYNGKTETSGAPVVRNAPGERTSVVGMYAALKSVSNALQDPFKKDTGVNYYYDTSSDKNAPQYALPSPYDSEGGRGELFSLAKPNDILADFNGLGLSRGFSLSSSPFQDAKTREEYWRSLPFHKDWYIPTLAEALYCSRNGIRINNIICSNGYYINLVGTVEEYNGGSLHSSTILFLRVVS